MNHEPPNPEKQEPESVFLPVSEELLQKILNMKYVVEVERTGIELQAPTKTRLQGRMVVITDENHKRLKEVRRYLRSMGGAEKVPAGKKARALSINDACDFVINAFPIPMRKKTDE